MKSLFERYMEAGADAMEASCLEDIASLFIEPADLRVALAVYRYLRDNPAVES